MFLKADKHADHWDFKWSGSVGAQLLDPES